MRFYFGLSRRISLKALIKWGLLILGGLLAFFGIDNIKGKALTNTQAPSGVKTCNFNGLFTDSSCVTEQPYNCSLSGLSSPFSCYVPNTTNYENIKPKKKSVWYSYTGVTSGNCNTSQTISFNVDIIMNDQFQANGAPSNATAEDGPWPPNALNYNEWQNVNPTTRGALTKGIENTKAATYYHDMYWQYLDSSSSKNKTGVKIYGYSSSTGYQVGACQFVSYLNYKTIRFLCTAPAKMSTYWVGQNIYNTNGLFASANTPNSYIRPAQYITNVSDPCVGSSSTDMSGVTSAINNQTSSIMSGFGDIVQNQNSNTSEITNNQNITNSKLDDIIQNQNETQSILLDTSSPTFNISDYTGGYIPSTVLERFVQLPLGLMQKVFDGIEESQETPNSCTPFVINLSPITRRWGNFDYTLTIPCIREKVKTLLTPTIYELFDMLMCSIVFYYFCMNTYNKIDSILSGSDSFPTFFHTKGRTTNYNAHVNHDTGEVTY